MMVFCKETIIKIVLNLIRKKQTMIDPYFIKQAKKYGIEFQTVPTKYTMEYVKKITIILDGG